MEYLKSLHFTNDWWAIVLPCILMVLDIITGYYNAWKKKKVSSKKMRDGLGKKLAEIVYIVIGVVVSISFNIKPVGYFISFYVIYMEIVSITENCEKLGLPIPKKIKEKINNKDLED